jgi:sugar phosphate isomerase/epimerase
MDLKEFPAMVVNRFNVHNIEPLGDHFRSTDPAYVHALREAVEKAGVQVVNIPVSVGASLYDPDANKRKSAVENAKKWVDVARALHSPSIRIHIQGVRGVLPDLDRTVEGLQALTEYGALRGIILNLENDDLVSEDAFFIVKAIEKVNSPYLHALPDFCNSMLNGNEQYNYEAVTAMFKHAYNISHVKDSEVNDQGKVFRVDPGKIFAIARENGYRGYFSMEWEGQGDPYQGTQKLINESLKHLA